MDNFFILPGIFLSKKKSLGSLKISKNKKKFFSIIEPIFCFKKEDKFSFFQSAKIISSGINDLNQVDKINPLKKSPGSFFIFNKDIDSSFEKNLFKLIRTGESSLSGADFLICFYFYYQQKGNFSIKSSIFSSRKLQLIILNSIQSIYFHQGVTISSKHIELIIRQLTSKAIGGKSYDIGMKMSRISFFENYDKICRVLLKDMESLQCSDIFYCKKNILKLELKDEILTKTLECIFGLEEVIPTFLGCTASSSNRAFGFLSSSGFQETKKVLSKAALFGSSDWLTGLKDSLVIGKKAYIGSSFSYSKNYLDSIYYYKSKKIT